MFYSVKKIIKYIFITVTQQAIKDWIKIFVSFLEEV